MTKIPIWATERFGDLEIGNLNLFGIWDLGFGYWNLNIYFVMINSCESFFKWLVVLNLCLVWAFFLPHCAKKEKDATGAPDFTLKTLDDKEITLSKLKGKVVLLDFWATWCGPCRESVPHLVQLYKTYQKNGLELIGMNMDRGNIDAVRRFVKSMDIPYPITVTPDDVERNYGITGLPTTILIDKEGKIRQRFIGFTNEMAKQMTALVIELASEKP